MTEPRISDEKLRGLTHPHERAIAPVWGNDRVCCDELVDDLLDCRQALAAAEARVAALTAALTTFREQARHLSVSDGIDHWPLIEEVLHRHGLTDLAGTEPRGTPAPDPDLPVDVISAEDRLLAHFDQPAKYDAMGFTRELRAIVMDRDREWCAALVATGDTDLMERVTKQFNATRSDGGAPAPDRELEQRLAGYFAEWRTPAERPTRDEYREGWDAGKDACLKRLLELREEWAALQRNYEARHKAGEELTAAIAVALGQKLSYDTAIGVVQGIERREAAAPGGRT